MMHTEKFKTLNGYFHAFQPVEKKCACCILMFFSTDLLLKMKL